MFRPTASIFAATLALALTACGSEAAPIAGPAPSASTVSASASPAPAPAPAPALDARGVVDGLAAAKLPLTNLATQDENTDPNDKIGRPGGYTSRASADVPGGDKEADKFTIERGLVVEVFATAEDADTRSKFIQDSLKSIQILGTEYHYRPADKRVLVRLSGKIKPSVAKQFEAAVVGL